MKHNRGFTLIELLVVIAIIGILASIILASLNSARSKGRDAQRIADIRQMQNALELYNSDNGGYPQGMEFSPWDATTWGGHQTLYPALVPKYIASLPKDPSGSGEGGAGNFLGDNYPTDRGYYYSSDGTHYTLGTNLENTKSPASVAGNYTKEL